MFRKKAVVILYSRSDGTGVCRAWSRFASYIYIFEKAYKKLKDDFGQDFTVTNVIKL